jgi:hypothetical protein
MECPPKDMAYSAGQDTSNFNEKRRLILRRSLGIAAYPKALNSSQYLSSVSLAYFCF